MQRGASARPAKLCGTARAAARSAACAVLGAAGALPTLTALGFGKMRTVRLQRRGGVRCAALASAAVLARAGGCSRGGPGGSLPPRLRIQFKTATLKGVQSTNFRWRCRGVLRAIAHTLHKGPQAQVNRGFSGRSAGQPSRPAWSVPGCLSSFRVLTRVVVTRCCFQQNYTVAESQLL